MPAKRLESLSIEDLSARVGIGRAWRSRPVSHFARTPRRTRALATRRSCQAASNCLCTSRRAVFLLAASSAIAMSCRASSASITARGSERPVPHRGLQLGAPAGELFPGTVAFQAANFAGRRAETAARYMLLLADHQCAEQRAAVLGASMRSGARRWRRCRLRWWRSYSWAAARHRPRSWAALLRTP